MSEHDSEELVEDAQIDGVRGPSRFGGFVRGVLFGGLVCGGAALVFSLMTPLPAHLPGVGSVEIVGSETPGDDAAQASESDAVGEPAETATSGGEQGSGATPVGQEPEPESPAVPTSDAATQDTEGTAPTGTADAQQAATQDQDAQAIATPSTPSEETAVASTEAEAVTPDETTPQTGVTGDGVAPDVQGPQASGDDAATDESTATNASDSAADTAQTAASEAEAAPRAPKLDGPALTVNARSFEAPDGAPLLAVVLEDAGNGAVPSEALTLMTMPLTLAIQPDGESARALADAARGSGHEVLVELPVDPEADGASPAEGALVTSQSPEVLQELTNRYLAELDSAVGVTAPVNGRVQNNPRAMQAVLEPVATHGFAYLDLKPGIGSTARRIAEDAGLNYAVSNRFVAAGATEEQVYQMLEGVAFQARRQGSAIVSISASPAALKALVRWGLERGGQEVWFAPLSAVIARQATE